MASRELAASHPIPIWMRGGLACALALSCAVPALANTYTVTSTADAGPGTLRQAIIDSEAQPGADTIQFAAALAGGTVTLLTVGDSSVGPAAFRINSDITIIGDAALGITIQRSSGSFRIFTIDTTGILTLRNVTLSSGRAMGFGGGTTQRGGDGGGSAGMGGGIFNNQGALTLDNCSLTGCLATGAPATSGGCCGWSGGGGGGGVGAAGSPTGGNAGGNGGPPSGGTGGAFLAPGLAGLFGGGGGGGGAGNSGGAPGGPGGFGGGGGGGGSFSQAGWNGTPGGDGGHGGFGGGGGGAGGSAPSAAPGAGGFGGADGTAAISGNIGGNGGGSAGMGAGLFNNAGTVSISASTFSGNSATGGGAAQGLGGGVFNRNGTVTITSSLFSGNTAAQGGGGAFNIGDGATAALNLRNVTFSGSTGSDVGEAEINSGTSTVTRIYGPACGCAPPLIGSRGGAPTMGNLAFSIAATGYSSSATGPAVLLLAGAPQAPPIPLYRQDCFLNVSPVTMLTLAIAPVTLTGTPPCTGESATPTPIPAMPWLRGVSVYLQWVAASPAAPSGFELTGALEVTLE